MNTKTIKFDLNKYKLYEKIKAKQGDTKSRFLLFQLLDGSIPFNLKNRSVRAYMVKPDGREIFNDLIVNNYNLGYCTLELTNQVLAVPGTVKIELMVTEEEKKLTSSVFELEVVKSINSEKSIVSTNEFTALLNGLAALSEYDNYKNAVKEMEINKADKAKVEEKFGEVYEQLDNIAKKINVPNEYIAYLVRKMREGQRVVIDCYGDSTYWGHASGIEPIGTQVSTPPPLMLQNILRSYFNNNNIIVNNLGAKGNSSKDVVVINTSTDADIIFYNYGINDAKEWYSSPKEYKNNIVRFVRAFRDVGKEVVLDIPNIVVGGDFAGHNMGSMTRAEQVKIMSNVMVSIAKQLKVPYIDNYNLTQQYTYSNPYIPVSMPDGMHPSDEMYIAKALNMASIFISSSTSYVDNNSIISCVDSSVFTKGTTALQKVKNSKVGFAIMSEEIKIGFNLIENSELYISVPVWSSGSNNMSIFVDGKLIESINLLQTEYNPTIAYLNDMTVLVLENISKGFHLIELKNNNNGYAGLNYVMTKPINKKIDSDKVKYEYDLVKNIEFINDTSSEISLKTEIPVDILKKDLIVNITAKFNDGEGILLFTTERANVTDVNSVFNSIGGILLYLSNGNLKIAEGDSIHYDTSFDVVSATDYTDSSHEFKIIVNRSNQVTIFVDGVKIKENIQMKKKCLGGTIGLWKSTKGIMEIEKISVIR